MAGKNERHVWLISDGAPGHLSQSRGVCDALKRLGALRVTDVQLRVKSKRMKSLARVFANLGAPLDFWFSRVYDAELPDDAPDAIVASGGNTQLAGIALSKAFSVPFFYSGTRKGFSGRLFSCLFSVTPQGGHSNVVLPLPPVPEAIAALRASRASVYPVALIGGDGAGYRFRETDWRALAAGLRKFDAPLLLTTSRRTGAKAESLLKQQLPAPLFARAVWWQEKPEPVVREFLAQARCVVVTEDSLTMIAEAIYAGCPVISVRPAEGHIEAQDEAALGLYVARGFLRRVAAAELATLDLTTLTSTPPPDVQALMAQAMSPHFAATQMVTR